MKTLILATVLAFATNAFASSDLVCEQAARDAVVGLVQGLGQEVTVESVTLVESNAKDEVAQETYDVKLTGKDFSSSETTNVWRIKLNDLGTSCGFSSLSLIAQ